MGMASDFYHIRLILFLLFLCNYSLNATASSNTETEYDKWLSWNVQNYKRKQVQRQAEETLIQSPGAVEGRVLDDKLWIAEMNKVRINVSQDGTGDFKTIKEALSSIPSRNTRRVILVINPGIYREKIAIPRTMPFITFLGDASNPPLITGNDTASGSGKDGMPFKTFQSATLAVDANYFVAININFEVINKVDIKIPLLLETFQNSKIMLLSLVLNTAQHQIGKRGGQAVAVRISGTKAAFYNCSFYGDQDTLYDHKGLHYFNNCFIQGSVDFIFGYGRSLYENCYLNSVSKKVASITAQKRSNASLASGFSFKDCVVTGGANGGLVYLGRAWGDYSRVVFSYTFMDKIVLPQGWSDWGDQKRDARVYYGEYKCSGPGANFTGRVRWARILTDEEAQPFLGTYYVEADTWLINPNSSHLITN